MTQSDRDWALLRSGKLDEDLAAVREEGARALFYAMLKFVLIEVNCRFKKNKVYVLDKAHRPVKGEDGKPVIRQRKDGWVAYFYRKHFGEWPRKEWERIHPIRPSDEVMAAVKARDAQYRKMKREEEDAKRGMENGEAADALQQGAEGSGAVLDGGRVPGLEE